jgi:hypothetical protein
MRRPTNGPPSDLAPRDFIICEHSVVQDDGSIRRQQCLRTAHYKYVFHGSAGSPGPGPAVELYHLEADPRELVNVAADPAYADQVARHAELLIAHRLRTESNAWKAGLAGAMVEPLDPFGLPTGVTPR